MVRKVCRKWWAGEMWAGLQGEEHEELDPGEDLLRDEGCWPLALASTA